MNRSELRAETRQALKDITGSASNRKWSTTLLDTRLNQHMIEAAARSECIRAEAYIGAAAVSGLVEGTSEYTMPTDFVKLDPTRTPEFNEVPVDVKTFRQLQAEDENYRAAENGIPETMVVFLSESGHVAFITPPPNTANALLFLYIWYIAAVTPFTADSTEAFNGQPWSKPYEMCIAYYTIAQCAKEAGRDKDFERYYGMAVAMERALKNMAHGGIIEGSETEGGSKPHPDYIESMSRI